MSEQLKQLPQSAGYRVDSLRYIPPKEIARNEEKAVMEAASLLIVLENGHAIRAYLRDVIEVELTVPSGESVTIGVPTRELRIAGQ